MNGATKEIVIAGVAAGVAAAVSIWVTHMLTKQATLENVASGKTPLPANATPTTTGNTPIVATPTPASTPPPEPQPPPVLAPAAISNLIQMASNIAVALPKCPPGYHYVVSDPPNPNLPGLCLQDQV